MSNTEKLLALEFEMRVSPSRRHPLDASNSEILDRANKLWRKRNFPERSMNSIYSKILDRIYAQFHTI